MILLWHWFLSFTGAANTTGAMYGFWSGFGSDISEFALLGTLIAVWRHSRCHVTSCRRHGKYPFRHYKLCGQHHPQVPQQGVTHLHIVQLHKKVK